MLDNCSCSICHSWKGPIIGYDWLVISSAWCGWHDVIHSFIHSSWRCSGRYDCKLKVCCAVFCLKVIHIWPGKSTWKFTFVQSYESLCRTSRHLAVKTSQNPRCLSATNDLDGHVLLERSCESEYKSECTVREGNHKGSLCSPRFVRTAVWELEIEVNNISKHFIWMFYIRKIFQLVFWRGVPTTINMAR